MISRTAVVVLVLLGMSGVPALISSRFHPELSAGPTPPVAEHETTVAGALSWGSDVLWVDVRTSEQFVAGHIPGAFSLDPSDWEPRLADMLERWRPGLKIVVYCDASSCDVSKQVAARLRGEVGLPEVYFLRGGWEAWQNERPTKGQRAQPQ